MNNIENIYLLKLYRESGELEEFYLKAPDDETALENAEQGFERSFQFADEESELGMKILEEKINE